MGSREGGYFLMIGRKPAASEQPVQVEDEVEVR